jgi:hypothetical protein
MNPQVFASIPLLHNEALQSFKTTFISIILEAFPFILLGVLVSSFMQMFISERTIQRFIPRNPILGILFACLLLSVFRTRFVLLLAFLIAVTVFIGSSIISQLFF